MKLLIFLLLSSVVYGQDIKPQLDTIPPKGYVKVNDSVRLDTLPGYGFGVSVGRVSWTRGFKHGEVDYESLDSNIKVYGDTVSIIRELIKDLEYRDSVIERRNYIIESSVDALNCIPDYWKDPKQNCKYESFLLVIKELGYTTGPREKQLPCCVPIKHK